MALPISGNERFAAVLERPQLESPRLPSPRLEAPRMERPGPPPGAPGVSFAEQVKDFVADINGLQQTAEQKTTQFANGTSNDIHGTMIAVQQADIALRMVGNVRNRVIELYREVMRMGS
jgi:flagellar hook-basal body complex protein FliE